MEVFEKIFAKLKRIYQLCVSYKKAENKESDIPFKDAFVFPKFAEAFGTTVLPQKNPIGNFLFAQSF